MITLMFSIFGCFNKGESAYQVAVRNGFEGTEKEWLESLKGTDGEKGEAGERGPSGADGKDGLNFNTGYTAESLYQEAVKNGYEGDFMSFIKEVFGSDQDLTGVVNKLIFQSCNIICTYYVKSGLGGGNVGYTSGGSGVFYQVDKEAGDALVVTNYHVLYNTSANTENNIIEQIEIFLYGDSNFLNPIQATFVGGSANYDLAVLKISNSELLKNSYVESVDWGDSGEITLGETVLAVGNPATDGTSVTKGIVSVCSEQTIIENVLGEEVNMRVIRHDSEVNPGNSGGGLFNAQGELIGIINAKLVKTNYDGMGYAIPSNLAKLVVENIIENCYGVSNEKVVKPYFGIYTYVSGTTTVYNEEKDRYDIIETVAVESVTSDSMVSGRIKKGDVINSYTHAGKTYQVKRLHDLSEFLLKVRVGDVLIINVTGEDGLNRNVTINISQGFMTYVE